LFAVRPPQISDSVVVSVTWTELRYSAALVSAGDAIASTLAIKRDRADVPSMAPHR
jgi:hypothetical protein